MDMIFVKKLRKTLLVLKTSHSNQSKLLIAVSFSVMINLRLILVTSCSPTVLVILVMDTIMDTITATTNMATMMMIAAENDKKRY